MKTRTKWLTPAIMLGCILAAGTAMRLPLFSENASAQGITPLEAQGYAPLNNTVWMTQTVQSDGDVGQNQSLVLDNFDVPHISYYNATQNSLQYAVLSGTTWLTSTVDTDAGMSSSLALDVSGHPHIAYHHTGPSERHAVLSGTTWLIDTVDNAVGAGESLAIDGAGNPHIAYCGFGQYQGTNYVTWTPSGWTRTSVDVTNCGGKSPSLVLDKSDRPHISYYDAANGDLKYAHLLYRVYLPLMLRN